MSFLSPDVASTVKQQEKEVESTGPKITVDLRAEKFLGWERRDRAGRGGGRDCSFIKLLL